MSQFRELCSSAKAGRACIDDLCRSGCFGGLTLCGFDQDAYDEMTREYSDDDPDDYSWEDE